MTRSHNDQAGKMVGIRAIRCKCVNDSDFFDLVAVPNGASNPKVTLWFKMAVQASHHIPVLVGKKEEHALTSQNFQEPFPEVASAYIPLARLCHMDTHGCKLRLRHVIFTERGGHVFS